jgi:hypothetical protein
VALRLFASSSFASTRHKPSSVAGRPAAWLPRACVWSSLSPWVELTLLGNATGANSSRFAVLTVDYNVPLLTADEPIGVLALSSAAREYAASGGRGF